MSGLFKVSFYKNFDTLALNGAPALSNSDFQRALCFTFHEGMKSSITSVVLQLMYLCMPTVWKHFCGYLGFCWIYLFFISNYHVTPMKRVRVFDIKSLTTLLQGQLHFLLLLWLFWSWTSVLFFFFFNIKIHVSSYWLLTASKSSSK